MNTNAANADGINLNAFESDSKMQSSQGGHDCLPEQLEKAKVKVEESGWQVDGINADPTELDAIYLYCFDLKTCWTWNCVISREMFNVVTQQVNSFTKAELYASVGGMISICSKVKKLEPTMVDILASSLALYIASTQTYEQAKRTHVHFAVIHYGQVNKVRPIAVIGERFQINSPSDTIDAIVNAIAYDKSKHPEWF